MSELWDSIVQFWSEGGWLVLVQAVATLVVGLLVASVLGRLLARVIRGRGRQQTALVVRRLTFYLLAVIAFVSALTVLGVDLTVLLGAAGVLTVALGFAAQTSASNLISGFFLMGERPFVVGDVIRVGETTGEVISIDMMSAKLRTFDNLLVRVPNETLLKSEIINLTHFPIRRVDVMVGVAYKEDIARVRAVLEEEADAEPMCLDEPAPLFIFLGYGDSSIDIQFSVWATRENFVELRNTIKLRIKEAFDREGIEIPFPHRTLYTGSVTEPFPVRVVDEP